MGVELSKEYDLVRFSANVLRDALKTYAETAGDDPILPNRVITRGREQWTFDTDDEFLAAYRQDFEQASYSALLGPPNYRFGYYARVGTTTVSVCAPAPAEIATVFEVFERNLESSKLPAPQTPPPEPIRVFIGHGKDPSWRDLKDYLQDKLHVEVVAYEIGNRAGHEIRDILDEMMYRASIAFLVMTGEDETADGGLRARQNVVHELGLFQGKLGFSHAIAVVEEGVEEFSNLAGVHQLRFDKGRIKELFGEVVATLQERSGFVLPR